MNNEMKILVNKAKQIINKTGNRPGTRYPQSLKKIVISMRHDHNMSVREIMKYVAISSYSAREWPKASKDKNVFHKISIADEINKKNTTKIRIIDYSNEFKLIIFNLKVLIVLIILLIFQSLLIHLVS